MRLFRVRGRGSSGMSGEVKELGVRLFRVRGHGSSGVSGEVRELG